MNTHTHKAKKPTDRPAAPVVDRVCSRTGTTSAGCAAAVEPASPSDEGQSVEAGLWGLEVVGNCVVFAP